MSTRFLALSIIMTLFFVAPVALAADVTGSAGSSAASGGTVNGSAGSSVPSNSNSGVLTNPLKANNLQDFVGQILDFLITIGSLVIVFMVVFVGFKFVMAQGEPGAIQEARMMLMWTLIGAAVLLGAKAISLGLQSTVQAITN